MTDHREWDVPQLSYRLFFVASVFILLVLAPAGSTATELSGEPAARNASAGAQELLDRAKRLVEDKKTGEALDVIGQALAAAEAAGDLAGQALGHGARARALEALERLEEALAAWREAAAAWERAGDGPGQVEALCAEALLLVRERPEAAASVLARATGLARKEARRPLPVITFLNDASERLVRTGRPGEAQSLAETALELGQQHAPGSLDVASSFSNLGNVAHRQGDLVTARDYHLRALKIRTEQAPGSLAVAGSFHNLGIVIWSQGNLVGARDYFLRALEIREKHAPGSREIASTMINLGTVSYRQGDLLAARDYYQRAQGLFEIHAPGSVQAALGLEGLGLVAKKQGNLAAARDYHERVLALKEKRAPASLEVAGTMVNLGTLASDQGDLAAARDYYQRALGLFETHAPGSLYVAASLEGLGLVARDEGDLAAARDYHERALALEEKHAPASLEVARTMTNLGHLTHRQGDLAAARDYHERALALQEKHAPGSLGVAGSLNNLGTVAYSQGNIVAARDYYLRALDIKEKHAPGSLAVASTLNYLGIVAHQNGDLHVALRHLQQSWDIVRRQAAAVIGDVAHQVFAEQYSSYVTELARVQLAVGESAEACQTLEEGRARSLLQILSERGLAEHVAEPELWQVYIEAESSFEKAGKMLAEAGVEEARLEQATRGLDAAADVGESELEGKRRELASARTAREEALSRYTQARLEMEKRLADVKRGIPGLEAEPLALEKARAALPAASVFLAFSVGEDSTLLFVVPAAKDELIQAHTLSLGGEELARRVASLREGIGADIAVRGVGGLAEVGAQTVVGASKELFEQLLPEQARTAVASARRVIVSPDGPLWELPFAALVTEMSSDGPIWLGLLKPLSYTPSLTVFALDRSRPREGSSSKEALVVGDPLFVRAAAKTGAKEIPAATRTSLRGERSYLFGDGQPPAPLPFTREEAVRVARLYGAEPLLGDAATEAAVRARLPQAFVIHLATHGYFHPKLAMSSGVLLTPPEKIEIGETTDDGVLQAWEFGRRLSLDADLVVLSACETGRGEKVRGEGLVGLTRSLLGAGARSVVATHWKVADEAAAGLMVSFHENLREGLPKDEALRRAMAKAHEATSQPFFWAAFFLTGDPDSPLTPRTADR